MRKDSFKPSTGLASERGRTAIWGGLEMGAELAIVAADPVETALRLRAADG